MVIGRIKLAWEAAKYIKKAVNYQDEVINSAWKTRVGGMHITKGARMGVRSGAAGGAVFGGLYEGLFSPADDTPGNAPWSESQRLENYKQSKTYRRYSRRFGYKQPKCYRYGYRSRQSRKR